MPQVNFYVLKQNQVAARLEFCARLAEKALQNRMTVVCLLNDASEFEPLSNSLWQLRPEAFLPHTTSNEPHHPIALTAALSGAMAVAPEQSLLINLSRNLPTGHEPFARIAEVVIQAEPFLGNSRKLFSHYRKLGYQPVTHNV